MRESALAVAREVASDLIELPINPQLGRRNDLQARAAATSLSSGAAGVALVYAELARLEPNEHHREHVMALVDLCVKEVAVLPMTVSLFSGFTGVAWMISRLDRFLLHLDSDPVDEVDGTVAELLEQQQLTLGYELTAGLLGLAVYGLERLPRPRARRILELILQRLEQTHVEIGSGWSWLTPPEQFTVESASVFPKGYFSLGLAHGVPGVISICAQCLRAGIDVERASRILTMATRWVLSTRFEPPAPVFPWMHGAAGEKPERSRAAWCYGDPGIAISLLTAAIATGDAALRTTAMEIAHLATEIPDARTMVRDAGLCHGSAGLAHIYNRIYQATGDEQMRAAAVAWIERTLGMRMQGEAVAGFPSLQVAPERKWHPEPGFLVGAAGVALALISAATDHGPLWDAPLLLNVAELA